MIIKKQIRLIFECSEKKGKEDQLKLTDIVTAADIT